MKSVPENTQLSKDLFTSFPGTPSASFSTQSALQGGLKVNSCSSTGFNPRRGRCPWQVPVVDTIYLWSPCQAWTLDWVSLSQCRAVFLLNGALSQAFPLVFLNVAALGCKAPLQDTKGHTAGKEPIFSPEEGCGCAHTMNLSASLLDSKQSFLNI